MNFHFRKRHEDDNAFMYAVWLRGQRNEGTNQFIGNKIYYANLTDRIKPLIERCQTIVVCNPDLHEQVYGFVCFEWLDSVCIIHYIHVKTPFRKMGVGKNLLTQANPRFGKEETVISFTNGFCSHRMSSYNLVFNPFVLDLLEEIRGKDNATRSIVSKIARTFGAG